MDRKPFFTDSFYQDPKLTLNVMNELVEKKQVAAKEMYQSGTFLFMDINENETTKKILSSVISDLEAYKAYNNENWTQGDATKIGLCALHDEHSCLFRFSEGNKEIKWNARLDHFVFSENIKSRLN